MDNRYLSQNKYDAILFDWDGTLADSFDFHCEVTRRFLKSRGFEATREQVAKNIGNTMECVLDGCGVPKEMQPEIVNAFDRYYLNDAGSMLKEIGIARGAVSLLSGLRRAGKKTGVVTNSKHALIKELVRLNHTEECLDVINGAHADSLNKETRCLDVIGGLGVLPARTLYVGDTRYDIMLAQKCGMDSCIVKHEIGWEKYYAVLAEELHPTYTAVSLSGVKPFALQLQ